MQKENNTHGGTPKELMTIETFLDIYGINKSRFYFYVGNGMLKITKDGRRTMIARTNAQDWLKKLQEATPE